MKKIVALIAKDKEEILKELEKTNGYKIDIFEIRADYLEDITFSNIEEIIKALREKTDAEIILTLRTKREGGMYEGLDYASKVHSFLDLTMDYIDLQINELTHQAMSDMIKHAKEKNTKVVLSVHHMNRGVNQGIFQYYIEKAKKYDADIVKIVDMPESRNEVISKLVLSGEYASKDQKPELLSISMGELGVISRYRTNLYKPEYNFINISDKINVGQFRLDNMDQALSKERTINFYTVVNTPIGKLYLYSDLKGICQINFEKPREKEDVIDISFRDAFLREAVLQLQEYFLKERKDFELKLSLDVSGFEKDVYETLMKTPYGHTTSYKQLAEDAGHKDAFRAVGTAMARNPIPVVIPCHRVVKSNGDLGEYGGGIYRKQILLTLEKED